MLKGEGDGTDDCGVRYAVRRVCSRGDPAFGAAGRRDCRADLPPVSGRELTALPGYRAAYGEFVSQGERIDEGIVLVLRAPKSYTGEDMAELSCHGNPSIAARLIAACVREGARPAAAGEFTRRAFENGKIDLAQAEAVAELIEAEGSAAASARPCAAGRGLEP